MARNSVYIIQTSEQFANSKVVDNVSIDKKESNLKHPHAAYTRRYRQL